MIYPSSMPPGSREVVPDPDQFGMKDWEKIELVSADQVKTQTFVILASQKDSIPQEEKLLNDWRRTRPTVFMLHANAGNVGHRLPIAKVFVQKYNFNVVAISYRGYGHSSGSPSEKGIILDSQTAFDYIKSHPILGNTPLFLYGQSLGGAVAVALASDSVNHGKVSGVILENTFANMRKLIPSVMPFIAPFSFLCHQTWSSDTRILNLKSSKDQTPFLFLSGSRDELVPPDHFRALYEACPSSLKIWKEFRKGTHNDTCLQESYFPIIGEWVQSHQ
ncbi:esterase/lipase [Melampsora americana]|nr:esterase/lipase [Melampsora americana]